MNTSFNKVFNNIQKHNQRQDGDLAQLLFLLPFAKKLGCMEVVKMISTIIDDDKENLVFELFFDSVSMPDYLTLILAEIPSRNPNNNDLKNQVLIMRSF
jgi:hypothetical protein